MFVRLICTARRLKRRKLELLQEKQAAYAAFKKKGGKLTHRQKVRRKLVDFQHRLRKCFRLPPHSRLYKMLFKIRHEGTCENFTMKSIAGFMGGFFLTYVFFMFFVLQLNFKLSTATIMCAIFGSILTIGLAFSYNVRCIVFLVLPQFFSKKGRQALLAYAYILAITGPAKNTLNNMSILGESMACGQEQLKAAVKQILEVIKKPFYAIRDAIKAVVKAVKEIVLKIKEILLSIKRIIMSLIKVIKAAFMFIAKAMNFCNKELGTPFERCSRVFEDAITDCNAKLGPLFNWLCSITYLVKSVCYIVKPLDFICIIVDFIKDTVGLIVRKVKQFIRHVRTMFYVRIKFSHSFDYESNQTKSMADITTGIVTEIKERSSGLIKIFDFMSSAASLFFIFMVVKVIYYRHKFLTNERFDNKFITKDFRQIDLRRAQLGRETVLPLNHRERQLYITTSSLRLIKKEKSQLSQSAMVLLMATLKLGTHMATDYSLYWIMTKIRYYGRFQSKLQAPNIPTLNIEGEGFLANLLRGIVRAFQPIGLNLEIDTIPCLPDPIPPDYDRYIQIGTLLILCWFLAIFEPYGLRFRHSVMCYYHPYRARERAIWLYNNIMRSRTSFLKFARRQLRRKVKGDDSIAKVTFTEFIRAKLHCKIFTICLGSGKQLACLLCGEVYRENDKKIFIKCMTPNCPGLYCEKCFTDLQNICTVCLDPIQYGDLSDMSEEKDSSEEEARLKQKSARKSSLEDTKKKPKKRRRRTWLASTEKDKRSDTETEDEDRDNEHYEKKSVNRSLLSPKRPRDKDSDHSSCVCQSTESDIDYEYQQSKDVTALQASVPINQAFADVEKQRIPDYASIKDFTSNYTDVHTTTGYTLVTSRGLTDMATVTGYDEVYDSDSSSSEITDLLTGSKPSFRKFEKVTNPFYASYRTPESFQTGGSKSQHSNTSSAISEIKPFELFEDNYNWSELQQLQLNAMKEVVNPNNYEETVETSFIIPPRSIWSSTSISSEFVQISTTNPTTDLNSKLKQTSTVTQGSSTQRTSFTNKSSNIPVHPDIPKLNLDFVNEPTFHSEDNTSESITRESSRSARLFKDSVRYNTIDERTQTINASYQYRPLGQTRTITASTSFDSTIYTYSMNTRSTRQPLHIGSTITEEKSTDLSKSKQETSRRTYTPVLNPSTATIISTDSSSSDITSQSSEKLLTLTNYSGHSELSPISLYSETSNTSNSKTCHDESDSYRSRVRNYYRLTRSKELLRPLQRKDSLIKKFFHIFSKKKNM